MRLFFLCCVFWLGAQSSFAAFLESEGEFTYHNRPARDVFLNHEILGRISAVSLRAMQNLIQRLIRDGEIPNELGDLESFNQFADADTIISDATNYLNSWSMDLMARYGGFLLTDTIPSAIVITIGTKAALEIVAGGGIAGNLGVVIFPIVQTPINKFTGEVSPSYYTAQVAIVNWWGPLVGVGYSASSMIRIGISMIWGSRQFLNIRHFVGTGGSVAISGDLGFMGFHVEGGFLNSPFMDDFIDFYIFTTTLDTGVGAGGEISGSVFFVQNLATALGQLNGGRSRRLVRRHEQLLAQELERLLQRPSSDSTH